jgi:hypothetical protein
VTYAILTLLPSVQTALFQQENAEYFQKGMYRYTPPNSNYRYIGMPRNDAVQPIAPTALLDALLDGALAGFELLKTANEKPQRVFLIGEDLYNAPLNWLERETGRESMSIQREYDLRFFYQQRTLSAPPPGLADGISHFSVAVYFM